MMTAEERNRERRREQLWARLQLTDPIFLHCQRCGAEFVTKWIADDCPHCVVNGAPA